LLFKLAPNKRVPRLMLKHDPLENVGLHFESNKNGRRLGLLSSTLSTQIHSQIHCECIEYNTAADSVYTLPSRAGLLEGYCESNDPPSAAFIVLRGCLYPHDKLFSLPNGVRSRIDLSFRACTEGVGRILVNGLDALPLCMVAGLR
jgi:hypothetical protein